jgi:hypothetical protein
MTSLTKYRTQMVTRIMAMLGRSPVPQMFSTQSQQVSYSEILGLPDAPAEDIQNADGTFKYMLGYDALGEAPLGG